MRKTIIRIEKPDGEPLEIEVNGRHLTGSFERGIFYAAAILLALGALWVTVFVVLPLLGIVLGFLFSIVGAGIAIAAIVVALVVLWAVISPLLERSTERRRHRDDWEDE